MAINAKNFFKLAEEARTQGTLGGKLLTSEERVEAFKKEGKPEFKTFVENVLVRKGGNGGDIRGGGGSLSGKPSQLLLPGSTSPASRMASAYDKRVDEVLNMPDPQDREVKPRNKSLLTFVKQINNRVGGILQIITKQTEVDNAESAKALKAAEKQGRVSREKTEESKAGKVKIPGPVMALAKPITDLWGNIVKAFAVLLSGWGISTFLNWFSDPKNKKGAEEFKEFVLVVLPKIIKGILLVTAVGLFAKLAAFTATIIAGTWKLGKALIQLAANMAKWAFANPKLALALGLTAAVAAGAYKLVKDSEESADTVIKEAEKEEGRPLTNEEKVEELQSPAGLLQTFTGTINKDAREGFAGGGLARGTDTVPAMLTPGEFIMSRGAVQTWGADTLASMNAAGGGNNLPQRMSGRVYAKGGGHIDVDGSGDGSTGKMQMYDKAGKRVGGSYNVVSGSRGTGNVSQAKRRNPGIRNSYYPMPDGDYDLHGFAQHQWYTGRLRGLGKWSSYIGPGAGMIGSREGIMLHQDIDPYGTAGCIGVQLGGTPDTKAEKQFLKAYKIANPDRIKVKLGKGWKGAGESDGIRTATADNSSITPSKKASVQASNTSQQLLRSVPGDGFIGPAGWGLKSPDWMAQGPPPEQGATVVPDEALFSSVDDSNLTMLYVKNVYGVVT